MGRHRTAAVICAAIGFLTLGNSARAQIIATVDDHGKLVYQNADPAPKAPSTAPKGRKFSQPAPGTNDVPPGQLDQLVQDAANRNGLDPALVRAVIQEESGWNPRAISKKGAVGLMQLVPGTAERYGVGNPFDPAQNVEGGTRYLRSLLERYNGDVTKSLAAYNAGENAVDRFGGVPLFPETQAYVRRISRSYFQPGSGRQPGKWTPPPLRIRRTVNEQGRVVFTNE